MVPSPNWPSNLCLAIEYQHVVVLAVGDEKPIGIIDDQAENAAELGVHAMLDQIGIVALRVENKDRSHLGIGHVQESLGIHRQPVRSSELEAGLGAGLLGGVLGADAGHAVHPRLFLDFGLRFLRILLLGGEIVQVPEPRDGRRLRPYDIGNVELRRLWYGGSSRLLSPSFGRPEPAEPRWPPAASSPIAL